MTKQKNELYHGHDRRDQGDEASVGKYKTTFELTFSRIVNLPRTAIRNDCSERHHDMECDEAGALD